MRYYKLTIDGKTLCQQSLTNPTGLNVQFNIQTYDRGRTANSEITVYNPPLWMFGEYMKLYDKKIQLFAGVANTPLTQIIGMTPPKQDLITTGYIGSVLPQINEADQQMTFVITQEPMKNRTDARGDTVGYQFRLSAQADAITAIKVALNKIAPEMPVKSVVSGSPKIPAPCQATVFTPADISSLIATWGLTLQCSSDGYVINDLWNPAFGKLVILKKQDLLCQPSPLGVSSMAITTYLRGDIQLGDRIEMPSDVFVGVSNLSGVITDSSGIDAFLNSRQKNLYTMFSGRWRVNAIWHVGDLRNTDPQSWSTHMEVVRV